ncbi:hypothetical protein ANN_18280 [Periplaneta americana]|uniref:Uncharacterized protein n=1 Tax=Periplaneta americana TaxID=6978 RepID=A0ABQ8SPA8_PERAM|nr:hypothetical protein ANN_18280 [Periplaneta americana]
MDPVLLGHFGGVNLGRERVGGPIGCVDMTLYLEHISHNADFHPPSVGPITHPATSQLGDTRKKSKGHRSGDHGGQTTVSDPANPLSGKIVIKKLAYLQYEVRRSTILMIDGSCRKLWFPQRWIDCGTPILPTLLDWPSRSPDFTTCDNTLWGFIKSTVAQNGTTPLMN